MSNRDRLQQLIDEFLSLANRWDISDTREDLAREIDHLSFAVPQLVKALGDNKTGRHVKQAILILARDMGEDSRDFVEPALEILKNTDDYLAGAAVDVLVRLGQSGSSETVDFLHRELEKARRESRGAVETRKEVEGRLLALVQDKFPDATYLSGGAQKSLVETLRSLQTQFHQAFHGSLRSELIDSGKYDSVPEALELARKLDKINSHLHRLVRLENNT